MVWGKQEELLKRIRANQSKQRGRGCKEHVTFSQLMAMPLDGQAAKSADRAWRRSALRSKPEDAIGLVNRKERWAGLSYVQLTTAAHDTGDTESQTVLLRKASVGKQELLMDGLDRLAQTSRDRAPTAPKGALYGADSLLASLARFTEGRFNEDVEARLGGDGWREYTEARALFHNPPLKTGE